MALKIRLTKVGSVHQPLYRVVVAEARSRAYAACARIRIEGSRHRGDIALAAAAPAGG